MTVYRTAQVARQIGIHPNTVRLYETLGLIPKPKREANGYRVFTDFQVEQCRFARTALQVEVLHNGLRKQVIGIIQTAAAGKFDEAAVLTHTYRRGIRAEQKNAEEALSIAQTLLAGDSAAGETPCLTRKETAEQLRVSMDTLRNWEMNGLLRVKRRQNGYRIYTAEDIRRLKMIRSLRCANYSLSAILRMLNALRGDPGTDIRAAIDTPDGDDDIISVCDKLLTSLRRAEENAGAMLRHLDRMKTQFGQNSPL